MLKFDAKGYLTPNGIIESSVSEMKKYLVIGMESDLREAHFYQYSQYSKKLKALTGEPKIRQWVNGSFVTLKKNPKDIDLVTLIDHKKVKELGDALDDFRSGAWEQYGVDAYIITTYPANNKHYSHYLSDCAYWLDKFGGTRRDRSGKKHSKGFLEIFY